MKHFTPVAHAGQSSQAANRKESRGARTSAGGTSFATQLLACILVGLTAGYPMRMQAQTSSSGPATTTAYDVYVSTPVYINVTNPVIPVDPIVPPASTAVVKPSVDFQLINPVPVSGSRTQFCVPNQNSIIQDCGLRQTPFEQNLVTLYLALHNIPASDLPLVYQYGTADLRNSLRAWMFNYLVNVIQAPASSRSASDQNLYNWMASAVENAEIAYYNAFKAEYDRWQADPCQFTPNPAFPIFYSFTDECGLGGLTSSPVPPDVTYFESVAMANSYAVLFQAPATQKLMADTEQQVAKIANYSALGASVPIALAGANAVSLSAQSIFPVVEPVLYAGDSAFEVAANAASTAEFAVESEVAASAAVSAAVGVGFVILGDILILAQASINFADETTNQNAINALLNYNPHQTPNLVQMLQGASGYQKLLEVFTNATMPDLPPSAAPPAYSPAANQKFFIIDNSEVGDGRPGNLSSFLTYQSWNANYPLYPEGDDSVALSFYGNGWLVSTRGNAAIQEQVTQTFSLSFDYIDPTTNIAYTAETLGHGKFLLTKAPALQTNQDIDCPVNARTGLTPYTTLPAYCRSAVVNILNLQIEGNDPVQVAALGPQAQQPPGLTYTVVNPQPPVFATQNFVDFTTGVGGQFIPAIDASTHYPPTVSLPGPPTFEASVPACSMSVSDPLPLGVEFLVNGNQTGFYAFPAHNTAGTYNVHLTATCDGVSTIQPFTINIEPGSANSANVISAQQSHVEKAAVASMNPSARITQTAGVNTLAATGPQFVLPTNGQSFTLTQGQNTVIPVYTSGDVVTITAGANALPTGMTLTDNGNGSANITGIPVGPPPACSSSCDSAIHGSDQNGNSATLALKFTINGPALPALASAQTVTWPAGQNSQLTVDGSVAANNTPTAIPLSFSAVGQWPSWATLANDGVNLLTVAGTPPVSAYGNTVALKYQYSYAGGQLTSPVYTINVKVGAPLDSLQVAPRLLFQVGVQGSGAVNVVTGNGTPGLSGNFKVNGSLPTGLSASQTGTSLTISGTPTYPGIFPIPVQYTDAAGNVDSRKVQLEITQPASFTGFPASINIYTGIPVNLSYALPAGFPELPAPSPGDGLPASASSGLTVTGGPSPSDGLISTQSGGLTISTQSGGLTISGTPSQAATYLLALSAQPVLVDSSVVTSAGLLSSSYKQTPVGSPATTTVTLNVIATPNTCAGQTITHYNGDLTVGAGQICQITGGSVTGSIISKGGTVLLNNTTVTGNVWMENTKKQAPSSLPVLVCGSTIGHDLYIQGEPNTVTIGGPQGSACAPNTIKGSVQILGSYGAATMSYNSIGGGLLASLDPTSVIVTDNEFGGDVVFLLNSAAVTVSSNKIGGTLSALGDSLSSSITDNTISKYLVCDADTGISGSQNTAKDKQGQCANF